MSDPDSSSTSGGATGAQTSQNPAAGSLVQPDDIGDQRPLAAITQEVAFMQFAGPLPHPAILQMYGRVQPDFPNRIIEMVENQSNHRMDIERDVIKGGIANERISTIAQPIVMIVALVGCFYLISIGKSVEALTALLGSIAVLGRVVQSINKDRREERRERLERITRLEAERAQRGQLTQKSTTTAPKPTPSKASRNKHSSRRRH